VDDIATKIEAGLKKAISDAKPRFNLHQSLAAHKTLINSALATHSPTRVAKYLKDAGVPGSLDSLRKAIQEVAPAVRSRSAKGQKAARHSE